MTTALSLTPTLAEADATTYAEWFACLADPTRVRVLHVVATAGGETTVGHLAQAVGISQSTCSHHVRKLADVGYVHLRRDGTATRVSVNQACCTGLPHAADAVMGALSARPSGPEDLPTDVTMRTLRAGDWPAVRAIYGEGIATRNATFETSVPGRAALESAWLPGHRWVAEIDGTVAGWATITRVSSRACYAGVGETSVYVGEGFRGRGVGTALLHRQVTAADAGELWTLQTSIFPENRASLTLHHSAGFRTIGVRERIARLDGVWRDTILLERRSS
ncbi:MAG TPA: metalloregulator ArsR/SmtB family transcription factor [Jiangellaceae bacterium]|jgi:L-amino acid N-acyltransferase YncA/DNA-binding transcriptional ArsR family regulator|nr:metalloregulator ArsR/SmtB family transcription factor [Jiangellaceae bacterium]